jgi:hypothetical protein
VAGTDQCAPRPSTPKTKRRKVSLGFSGKNASGGGREAHEPILMQVTRRPQALSTTPTLLAVTPLPSPLTTPPVMTTYLVAAAVDWSSAMGKRSEAREIGRSRGRRSR